MTGVENAADAGRSDNNARPEDQTTKELIATINKVEAAIRDLVRQERETQSQTPADKEVRDLYAQEGMALWTQRMGWAAVVGVIFTFVGLILLGKTMRYTRDAAKYAEGMLKEAEKTTTAALETIAVTRDTAERQLRAYVHIIGVQREPYKGRDPKNFEDVITIQLKNFGPTPAYGLSVKAATVWAEREAESVFDDSKTKAAAVSDLGPGSDHFTTKRIGTTSADYLAFQRGKRQLFVYGVATYEDTFGNTQEVCFRLRNTSYAESTFANCETGNHSK